MTRTFSPSDLVAVPRTSATSAMALGTALVTAARQEPKLPPLFVPPLKRVEKECEALRTTRQFQREADSIDVSDAGEIDQQVDSCWSGLHGTLTGMAKFGAAPEGAERAKMAREVIEVVFPDGLRFLNLPYRDQWSESLKRLDRLAEPRMVERTRALGVEPLVEVVRAAHERYGAVLHLTQRKAEVQAQAKVREGLERLMAAVRSYVLRVSNYLDEHEGDAEAQAIGRALLEPLATWKSAGGRKAAAEVPVGEEPGDEPGEGPGGGYDEPNEE
jgi:hypothetical protein